MKENTNTETVSIVVTGPSILGVFDESHREDAELLADHYERAYSTRPEIVEFDLNDETNTYSLVMGDWL